MQAPSSGRDAGIESELLDLSDVPLSRLRTLDGSVLSRALRHATERVTHIAVTASTQGGAKRVD